MVTSTLTNVSGMSSFTAWPNRTLRFSASAILWKTSPAFSVRRSTRKPMCGIAFTSASPASWALACSSTLSSMPAESFMYTFRSPSTRLGGTTSKYVLIGLCTRYFSMYLRIFDGSSKASFSIISSDKLLVDMRSIVIRSQYENMRNSSSSSITMSRTRLEMRVRATSISTSRVISVFVKPMWSSSS